VAGSSRRSGGRPARCHWRPPAAPDLARLVERGRFVSRDDLVFCGPLGEHLDPSAIRRRYRRTQEAVGLPLLTFTVCAIRSARWSSARSIPSRSKHGWDTGKSPRRSGTSCKAAACRRPDASTAFFLGSAAELHGVDAPDAKAGRSLLRHASIAFRGRAAPSCPFETFASGSSILPLRAPPGVYRSTRRTASAIT
jgi:hypothetical protein